MFLSIETYRAHGSCMSQIIVRMDLVWSLDNCSLL